MVNPVSLHPSDAEPSPLLNEKGAPVTSPAPVIGYGPGSIAGQTSTQSARRSAVVDLWMGGASYREIKDALNIGSFLTVQRDIEFSKDVLRERFAGELSERRAIALQRLEFIVEETMESLSSLLPLSISDKTKLMNTILRATELKAKIEGVLDGSKSKVGDQRPQRVVYIVNDDNYRMVEEGQISSVKTESVQTPEV